LLRSLVKGKGTKSESEKFQVIPLVFTDNIAASRPRTVCGIADAKAVNLKLAQQKTDKHRFDMFVAERRNVIVEIEKVMFS
jgi:hypothetical protein